MAVDFVRAEPSEAKRGFYGRYGKRALDLALVLFSAPVTSPLIAMLGLMVRLGGGPAFYSHERIGKGGRVFRCWKLRTMEVDSDRLLAEHLAKDGNAAREWRENQKLQNDPRVTRAGAFLRKTSLDELPQLWNILIGDMSIVGPRPFMPDQEEMYTGAAYYTMRPGLTGLWQVGDRSDESFAARAAFDARYARELSLKTDVDTIVKTVGVVLKLDNC